MWDIANSVQFPKIAKFSKCRCVPRRGVQWWTTGPTSPSEAGSLSWTSMVTWPRSTGWDPWEGLDKHQGHHFQEKPVRIYQLPHTMEGPGQGPCMPGPWRMPRVNPWSPGPGLSYSGENPRGRPLSRAVHSSGSPLALRPQQPQLQTSKIQEVRACTGLQGEGATIS